MRVGLFGFGGLFGVLVGWFFGVSVWLEFLNSSLWHVPYLLQQCHTSSTLIADNQQIAQQWCALPSAIQLPTVDT